MLFGRGMPHPRAPFAVLSLTVFTLMGKSLECFCGRGAGKLHSSSSIARRIGADGSSASDGKWSIAGGAAAAGEGPTRFPSFESVRDLTIDSSSFRSDFEEQVERVMALGKSSAALSFRHVSCSGSKPMEPPHLPRPAIQHQLHQSKPPEKNNCTAAIHLKSSETHTDVQTRGQRSLLAQCGAGRTEGAASLQRVAPSSMSRVHHYTAIWVFPARFFNAAIQVVLVLVVVSSKCSFLDIRDPSRLIKKERVPLLRAAQCSPRHCRNPLSSLLSQYMAE
jgi:hypothetical protein